MAIIYTLSAIAWIKYRGEPILYFILTVVAVNASLIGISTVDWDNRFYIPMEPGIVLLAGCGLSILISKVKREASA